MRLASLFASATLFGLGESTHSSSKSHGRSLAPNAAAPAHCLSLMDMVFLIDESNSIGEDNWNNTLIPFTQHFVNAMHVSLDQVRVASVTFSTESHLKWPLDTYTNNTEVAQALGSLIYANGSTYTNLALSMARTQVLYTQEAAREEITKLAVVLTDGLSNEPSQTQQAAQSLKDAGTAIAVVGIDNANETECSGMASSPDLYTKTNWTELINVLPDILLSICNSLHTDAVCGDFAPWGACSQSCSVGTRSRVRSPYVIAPPTESSTGVMGRTCEQQGKYQNETDECTPSCPVDAGCGTVVGDWSSCSSSCGAGTMQQHLYVISPAQNGGKTCEEQGWQQTYTKDCMAQPTCVRRCVQGPV
eukprot:GHVS01010422.1.p1 GENE.GHVS01010422.1~~GHVS01010422.1.p1  ORF type:complete len:361 (+),score=35.86 GHVS01010422.1:188-1270(+)